LTRDGQNEHPSPNAAPKPALVAAGDVLELRSVKPLSASAEPISKLRTALAKRSGAGHYAVRLALLFGSRATGKANARSDIDLAVEAHRTDGQVAGR